MKKTFILLGITLCFLTSVFSQVEIVQEDFGTSTYDGNPANYPGYTSDALFAGDDSHMFQTPGSEGYSEASGASAILMGSWSTEENIEFIIQYNTSDYTTVRLSFGIKHNSGGWGTCQLTNNYTKIEYSTDSSSWTTIDKASLMDGSSWPCADDDVWSYVELAEILPSSATLNIRFTHTDPSKHPYFLDDITLTGFLPDETPPSKPGNLMAENVSSKSFILVWDASTDDNGVSYYKIFKNGNYLMTTTDTVAKIDYQLPGSTNNFAVIAYDIADNPSEESEELSVPLNSLPVDYEYPWQKSQVNFQPEGTLEWQPEDFVFEAGSSVRYIDYENGDDSNDGQTTSTPWKHHPWDENATDNAAACSGIHTYIFKRGVVYRGVLTAQESGSLIEPIRLTSDPTWGTGEAFFFGSKRFTGGWTQADETSAPNIPNPENVWYIDTWLPETKIVCEIDGENYKQLHVARSPNYKYTADDPLKTWWEWTSKSEVDGDLWLRDRNNLTQTDPAYYEGATVFSQEDAIVMCTVWCQDIKEWDAENNRVRVKNTNFGGTRSKYFIENTPFLLDTTSEFYYDQEADRLFVRLDDDKDPNTTIIEAATKTELIKIDNKHNIEISGISFGITTNHAVRYGEEDSKSTIRMTGICNNIKIKNNKFLFVNGGISLNSSGSQEINSHNITVSDNDFQKVGDLAIVFSSNSGVYLDDIKILRNRINTAGYRHQGRWYSSIPAIYGQLNYGEVAGNIIYDSWGNGIDMFWGKGGGSNLYVPFVRGLIYQNQAYNTLIGTNDYGGIESWQGGPTYCFNNYSHNASGYKHYNNSSIGYAYYFDGSFKHIVFNNIASGVSHNRNSACIQQVLGFYNMYVHNTGYNTKTFLRGGSNNLALNGHNTYLSNIGEDIENFFLHQLEADYIPFESYGYNISSNAPFKAALEDKSTFLSLSEFKGKLESYDAQLTQTGWEAAKTVLTDAESHDFRPLATSEAIDRGVKFFTSFPLAKVVGEWNFYKHPADLSIIMGDNFYMTQEFSSRTSYKSVPKNHLTAYNVDENNFVKGDLEDWTDGALVFDGSSVYCSVSHTDVSSTICNNVDMTTNDFIIEAYLKTETDHTNGVIVSKYDGSAGFELSVDASGMARMTLYESGSAAVSRISSTAINDGTWHHMLVEVNRYADINIYIDGEVDNGALTGAMPEATISLSNSSDLLVGKDEAGNFFNGTMDYLRISKASLYEAKTTIDELYTWETDGPFLYDMSGTAPIGTRDAGAIEMGEKLCDLSFSPESLNFDETAATKNVTVTASEGFDIQASNGDFFSTNVTGNTIEVTVNENPSAEDNVGTITIMGCNDSRVIDVIQAGSPCVFNLEKETLTIDSEAQTTTVKVTTNGQLSVSSNKTFVIPSIVETNDTISIRVFSNSSSSERTAEIEINTCDGIHTITLIQEGVNTSVDELKTQGLNIYPNPVADGLLNIKVPKNIGEYTCTLSELTGKVVHTEKIYDSESTIQLNVAAGIYILKITGEELNYQTQITVQ